MTERTILIATADNTVREHLAAHLDADGHTVQAAHSSEAATAKLTSSAIDVLVLGDLQQPAESLALLRRLRAGRLHTRVHPQQPVITLGADDLLSTLHAYEAGSDHHLARDADYLVLRAVIASITRRTADDVTSRHLHIGTIHIDTAARTVDVDGEPVHLSKLQYDLLARLASDPSRVFTKDELVRSVWGAAAPRTVDNHACHLRRRLRDAGATQAIQSIWGVGYRLGCQD